MKKVIAAGLMTGVALLGAAPAQAEQPFLTCPSRHSGVATSVTSCAFAESVRAAYFSQDKIVFNAYSPVTGEYYTMQCADGFTAQLNSGAVVNSVRCVGGNNAVVIVW